VVVEGVPKYIGYPGIIKGNRAVEILAPIAEKNEKGDVS
jgi:flagellar motor switch protein FliM